uniref:Uncharacterized protein n=1 Tax=Romanomermis culicivorax TaxID=13658 RepID=A0A915J9V2_ROMCU
MASCIAIIDKDVTSIDIRPADELKVQFAVYSSLDVIEERLIQCVQSKQPNELRELYLGLLLTTEKYRVYGLVTNTKVKSMIVKLVLLVESNNTNLKDQQIRALFRNLHTMYSNVICNPFYIPQRPIVSRLLDASVIDMLR